MTKDLKTNRPGIIKSKPGRKRGQTETHIDGFGITVCALVALTIAIAVIILVTKIESKTEFAKTYEEQAKNSVKHSLLGHYDSLMRKHALAPKQNMIYFDTKYIDGTTEFTLTRPILEITLQEILDDIRKNHGIHMRLRTLDPNPKDGYFKEGDVVTIIIILKYNKNGKTPVIQ